jgi:uncharacterized membrane protein (UPF0127 family)
MNHSIEHRGYINTQIGLNWHCVIMDKDGVVKHIHETKPCTDDELRKMIDDYIELSGREKLWEAYKGARNEED